MLIIMGLFERFREVMIRNMGYLLFFIDRMYLNELIYNCGKCIFVGVMSCRFRLSRYAKFNVGTSFGIYKMYYITITDYSL